MARIITLPGDGIGPEVTAAAVEVLQALRDDLTFEEHLIGGASIDAHGTALTDDVLAAARASDAVLLGAVGGPKWDTTDPDRPRPEQGLLGLRRELDLYANLRPVRPSRALLDASPLRREVIEGTDLVVVRELTGGIYFGEILTDNMFGDILSDEAAMLTGSIGMLPSASVGAPGTPGMFEPVHGSAPDIAGRGIANPLAMFLSAAMMLRHGLGFENEAAALESAVDRALENGLRTHDLGARRPPSRP